MIKLTLNQKYKYVILTCNNNKNIESYVISKHVLSENIKDNLNNNIMKSKIGGKNDTRT